MREIHANYHVWPPYTTPVSPEPTKASIELTFDLEIPLEIWARYHDNEDKLAEWAISYLFETKLKYIKRED